MPGHPQGGGILTIFATLLCGIYESVAASQLRGAARRDRERAARQHRADERASLDQQRRWFEAAKRQKARGHAGFATEAEARAALSGKGGRPSKLDGRKF